MPNQCVEPQILSHEESSIISSAAVNILSEENIIENPIENNCVFPIYWTETVEHSDFMKNLYGSSSANIICIDLSKSGDVPERNDTVKTDISIRHKMKRNIGSASSALSTGPKAISHISLLGELKPKSKSISITELDRTDTNNSDMNNSDKNVSRETIVPVVKSRGKQQNSLRQNSFLNLSTPHTASAQQQIQKVPSSLHAIVSHGTVRISTPTPATALSVNKTLSIEKIVDENVRTNCTFVTTASAVPDGILTGISDLKQMTVNLEILTLDSHNSKAVSTKNLSTCVSTDKINTSTSTYEDSICTSKNKDRTYVCTDAFSSIAPTVSELSDTTEIDIKNVPIQKVYPAPYVPLVRSNARMKYPVNSYNKINKISEKSSEKINILDDKTNKIETNKHKNKVNSVKKTKKIKIKVFDASLLEKLKYENLEYFLSHLKRDMISGDAENSLQSCSNNDNKENVSCKNTNFKNNSIKDDICKNNFLKKNFVDSKSENCRGLNVGNEENMNLFENQDSDTGNRRSCRNTNKITENKIKDKIKITTDKCKTNNDNNHCTNSCSNTENSNVRSVRTSSTLLPSPLKLQLQLFDKRKNNENLPISWSNRSRISVSVYREEDSGVLYTTQKVIGKGAFGYAVLATESPIFLKSLSSKTTSQDTSGK